MIKDFGNPDINTLNALESAGWKFNFVGNTERWESHSGYIEVFGDGYTQIWTRNDDYVFTVSEIVGFAMLRGLITINNCQNCEEYTIQPQTIETPCMDCGYWSGEPDEDEDENY